MNVETVCGNLHLRQGFQSRGPHVARQSSYNQTELEVLINHLQKWFDFGSNQQSPSFFKFKLRPVVFDFISPNAALG